MCIAWAGTSGFCDEDQHSFLEDLSGQNQWPNQRQPLSQWHLYLLEKSVRPVVRSSSLRCPSLTLCGPACSEWFPYFKGMWGLSEIQLSAEAILLTTAQIGRLLHFPGVFCFPSPCWKGVARAQRGWPSRCPGSDTGVALTTVRAWRADVWAGPARARPRTWPRLGASGSSRGARTQLWPWIKRGDRSRAATPEPGDPGWSRRRWGRDAAGPPRPGSHQVTGIPSRRTRSFRGKSAPACSPGAKPPSSPSCAGWSVSSPTRKNIVRPSCPCETAIAVHTAWLSWPVSLSRPCQTLQDPPRGEISPKRGPREREEREEAERKGEARPAEGHQGVLAVRTRAAKNEFRSGRGLTPKNSPGVGIRARMSRRVPGWRRRLRAARSAVAGRAGAAACARPPAVAETRWGAAGCGDVAAAGKGVGPRWGGGAPAGGGDAAEEGRPRGSGHRGEAGLGAAGPSGKRRGAAARGGGGVPRGGPGGCGRGGGGGPWRGGGDRRGPPSRARHLGGPPPRRTAPPWKLTEFPGGRGAARSISVASRTAGSSSALDLRCGAGWWVSGPVLALQVPPLLLRGKVGSLGRKVGGWTPPWGCPWQGVCRAGPGGGRAPSTCGCGARSREVGAAEGTRSLPAAIE